MKTRLLALAACLCAAPLALAEEAAALKGNWQGRVQMPDGFMVEVLMRAENGAGTWTATPHSPLRVPNPCFSRALPIALSEIAPGNFKIEIQAARAVPGCANGRATVRLVDGRLLEGKFADGRPLKLERR